MLNPLTYEPNIKLAVLKAAYAILSNPDACSKSGTMLNGINTKVECLIDYLTIKEHRVYDISSGNAIFCGPTQQIFDNKVLGGDINWLEADRISINMGESIKIEIIPESYDPCAEANVAEEITAKKEPSTWFGELIGRDNKVRYRIETFNYPVKYRISLYGALKFSDNIDESEYNMLLDTYKKSLAILDSRKYDHQKDLEKNVIEFLNSIS
jgi:hypothetical protein